MRTFLIASLLALSATAAHAQQCEAPANEVQEKCLTCNDLEENPSTGINQGWNEFLQNADARLSLLAQGYVRINLVNPDYASAGVLYYTLEIFDPSWSITSGYGQAYTQTYSQYVQYMLGVNAQGMPHGQIHARFVMSQALTNSFNQQITRGGQDYRLRLYNSAGQEISTVNRSPGAPPATPYIPDISGFPTNGEPPVTQYSRSECFAADERVGSGSSGDGGDEGGSSGGGDESGDNWEGWGNGYGEVNPPGCYEDPDPYEGGVVCPNPF